MSKEKKKKERLLLKKDCPYCHGLGSTICSICSGRRFNIYSLSIYGLLTLCPSCGGAGRKMCIFCNGTGKVKY